MILRQRQITGQMPGQRFIDPDLLARIDNLELVARTVVDGFVSGLHRSPMLGLSVDFAEHRAYAPGDDVRRIDWRVYARTDRLYVKEFEADTNANLNLILDISKSMDFGSGGLSKLDYAKFLAASLAYLSMRQRDRIGLMTFDNDLVDIIPASTKHFDTVLHSLDRLSAGNISEYKRPLKKIAEIQKRRSLLVLMSDLYDEPDGILAAVNQLRYRGNDLIVFHLLDPLELTLKLGEVSSVEDLESGARIPIAGEQFRDRYQQLVKDHQTELQKKLGSNQIDYIFADISQPLDSLLFRYLSERERQIRTR